MLCVVFASPKRNSSAINLHNKRSFTLLELIIVIIIIGILAVLGFTQYTKITEKMRQSEAVAALGSMRKLAHEYYLKNGALGTVTLADLGVGTGMLPLDGACRTTHSYDYVTTNWCTGYCVPPF